MGRPLVRYLFRTPDLQLGEFHCPPGHPMWREENNIGAGHHVVFPRTAVRITHAGADPVVSTPNHAIFYNSNQPYRRDLISEQGDHCVFLIVDPELLAEIAFGAGGEPVTGDFRFEFTNGPAPADAYLAQRLVVRRLASEKSCRDELSVHEVLLEAVHSAVSGAYGARGRRHRPQRTAAADAVEGAKEILAREAQNRTSLDELSRAVYLSPYHLARQFRARTGYTIRGYRNQLRVRSSLEAVVSGAETFAAIAHRLGFASHSHFTDAFRRAFGSSPASVRRQDSGRRPRTSTS